MPTLAQTVLNALARLLPPGTVPGTSRAGQPRPGSPEAFLAGERQKVRSQSGNVVAARWLANPSGRDGTLVVTYQGGAEWSYSPVSKAGALELRSTNSAGTWLWRNVRVAGSRHAHKVTARRLR